LSSPTDNKHSPPINDIGELVDYLAEGARKPEDWRIGTEHEKFGFRNDDLRPPTYEGPRGIGALLNGIADRFGFIHQGELLTTRSPRDLVSERADRFIVRYQASAALDGAHAAIRDGEYEQELDEHALPAFLTRLQAADGRLMTVKPAVSLETVFFKILEGEQTAPASGPR